MSKNDYSSESKKSESTNILNEEQESYRSNKKNDYSSENISTQINNNDIEKYKKGKPTRSIIKARLIND